MAASRVAYHADGRDRAVGAVTTPTGRTLTVSGLVIEDKPRFEGPVDLRSNRALTSNLWAYTLNEAQARRLRSPERRNSHRKQADLHAGQVATIADMTECVAQEIRRDWCSACFDLTDHRRLDGFSRPLPTFLCQKCGSPTSVCVAPRCSHMALRRVSAASAPRYCAEHRHDIPAFDRLEQRLSGPGEWADWLTFDKRNLARVTRIGAVTAAAGIAVLPMAIAAAPAIGGATGAWLSGLSGAAATSNGLAIWGGGSLAAGGLGMAGGTVVISAVGTGLGGTLGGVVTSAYVRSDPSFRVECLRPGEGSPVIVSNGFLTEGTSGWAKWRSIVDARYPERPVYRLHWGAKELKTFGAFAGSGAAKQALHQLVRGYARKASAKAADAVPGLGQALFAADLAKNPWSVAKYRAAMTGAVLADLIRRTDDDSFVLIGHSLGARVMVTAAQALGTEANRPRIEELHLMGAAVGNRGDWRTLSAAVRSRVWNYHSENDLTLRRLYRAAELGQSAVGAVGFQTKHPKITDKNVSRLVLGHGAYFDRVVLA